MGSSWFIKGIGYLLIAVFLGIVLWLVRLKPKKVRKKRKPLLRKVRKPAEKRRPAKKRRRK